MNHSRPIHPDFEYYLGFKDKELINLFLDLREYLLDIYPPGNELLYHTHALTSLFAITEKMGSGFCMIPIYSNHLNLGFNKGTLLPDPHKLLQGTGKYIRHIPISNPEDYRKPEVHALVQSAIDLAIEDLDKASKVTGKTISKIKR